MRALPEGAEGEQREASMSLDEIKSELDLRGVDYSDCLSKPDLVKRLVESRALGKANPSAVFERFNEVKDADVDPSIFDSDAVQDSVAADGTLPGGLPPAMMKMLAGDKEIMSFLRDPKMQAIMSDVMKGGPDAMKKYMSDPAAIRMLQALAVAMQRVQTNTAAGSGAGAGPGAVVRERPDEPDVLQ